MPNRPASWESWPVEVRELYEKVRRARETTLPSDHPVQIAGLLALKRLYDFALQEADPGLAEAATDAALELRTPEELAKLREEYRRSGGAAFEVARLAELVRTAPTQELRDGFTALLELHASYLPRGKA
jgi:hypothetical protein